MRKTISGIYAALAYVTVTWATILFVTIGACLCDGQARARTRARCSANHTVWGVLVNLGSVMARSGTDCKFEEDLTYLYHRYYTLRYSISVSTLKAKSSKEFCMPAVSNNIYCLCIAV